MKKVVIAAVGKIKEKFMNDGIGEYAKRLSAFCDFSVAEVADKGGIKAECEALKGKLKGYKILLDLNGQPISSPQLSVLIEKAHLKEDVITFIIGGSDGVDDSIRNLADAKISFGQVTYPHQLMRLILSEQIYRAFTISKNMPYHK